LVVAVVHTAAPLRKGFRREEREKEKKRKVKRGRKSVVKMATMCLKCGSFVSVETGKCVVSPRGAGSERLPDGLPAYSTRYGETKKHISGQKLNVLKHTKFQRRTPKKDDCTS
jgi:hypothetical protein